MFIICILKIHKEKLKNWMQNFIKIINNHRFTKQDIPFVRDFLMSWSNRVMSIEKSLPGLNSTFLSYLLPLSFGSTVERSRFIKGGLMVLSAKGGSKTNRYYHYLQLLFFAQLPPSFNAIVVRIRRNDFK